MPAIDELRARGEIGGRTVQIESDGSVACVTYEPAPLEPDAVRIRDRAVGRQPRHGGNLSRP